MSVWPNYALQATCETHAPERGRYASHVLLHNTFVVI